MTLDSDLLSAGIEHHKAGRLEQAYEIYRSLLAADPDNVTVRSWLGAVCIDLERDAEATSYLAEALRLDPNHHAAYNNLGMLLSKQGRIPAAIESFHRAAQLNPNSAQTHLNLAAALQRGGRRDEAIESYRRAAQLDPDSRRANSQLARLLHEAGRAVEAVPYFRQIARLKRDDPSAHFELAVALAAAGQTGEAIAVYQETLRLKPDSARTCVNLASLFIEKMEFDEARRWACRAIQMQPRIAEAHYNLSIALSKQGNLAEAIEQCDHAISIRPHYAEAHHNRASVLLLLGRMQEGLAEYEWRFRSSDFPPFHTRWKSWDGRSPEGRTIVLVAEQGLGDTMQFVRYANALAARGARVIVECPSALHPLLARTPGVERWISPTDPAPDADGGVPLLSMPYRMRTTLEAVPAEIPYIFADEERIAAWRERLAGFREFNVGIVWQGNPQVPADQQRSIPLARFAPLARTPGVRLFSLQYGYGVEQLDSVSEAWGIVDFGGELNATGGAFMDTAAIMKHLDLVVTSDTAAAHLAGALGVQVWVALQMVPDWRWLLDRDDSPWYPTMRLFRQTRLADWDGVFERVAAELGRLVRA